MECDVHCCELHTVTHCNLYQAFWHKNSPSSLLYDLRLAAHRFPLEMTLERDVINKLEHIITDSTYEDVLSCSPYVLQSALSVSDIVRENIWSVHQWQKLEGVFKPGYKLI